MASTGRGVPHPGNRTHAADGARRGAATRAANERTRIEDDRGHEKQRRHKNALARERYAERRRTEAARVDKRTAMHALVIEVDPAAYQAVKVDARGRGTTIPRVIGDLLRSHVDRGAEMQSNESGPRWRRTGGGRRAAQHIRVDVEDAVWDATHLAAKRRGVTFARQVGHAIEHEIDWSSQGGTPGQQFPGDASRTSSIHMQNVAKERASTRRDESGGGGLTFGLPRERVRGDAFGLDTAQSLK